MRREPRSNPQLQNSRVFELLLCIALIACGSNERTPTTPEPDNGDSASTLRRPDGPPLTVIRRQGDPLPSVAIAIAHDAGPSFNLGLADALQQTFRKRGLAPEMSLLTRGLVATLLLPEEQAKSPARLAEGIQAAVLETASTAKARSATAATDPCDPIPSFIDEPPELGYHNVSVAAVGPSSFSDGFARAFEALPSWPRGDIPAGGFPERDLYVTQQTLASELWLSVRTPTSAALIEARRSLLEHRLLRKTAQAFPPGFELSGIDTSFLPAGGCLTLRFEAVQKTRTEDVARLVMAARTFAEDAIKTAQERDRLWPALSSESAARAARLAAWQALAAEGGEQRFIAIQRSPEQLSPEPLESPGLQRAVQAAAHRRTLTLKSRVEQGQGKLWAAVVSACPVAHEHRETAGYTELSLRHAAHGHEELQAWLGYGGPALIARVPMLDRAQPEEVADRLAEGLLDSLSGNAELLMLAREQRERRPQTGLIDFTAELTTFGRPSRLFSHGTRKALASVNPESVEAALLGFLQSPLSLAVIANSEEGQQAERVRSRLEILLAPFLSNDALCPEVKTQPLAGVYSLLADGPHVDVVLSYPVPLSEFRSAQVVAYLLSRSGGFIERSLVLDGLAIEGTAAAVATRGGSAALMLALTAEPETSEDATHQARALLQRIAGGAILEKHYQSAAEHFAKPSANSTQQRLLNQLIELPQFPTLVELRRFAHQHLTERHLVVVRTLPEP